VASRQKQNDTVAEVVKLFVGVLLAFGLIIAGFYARSHGVNDQWFFYGAGAVIFVILFEYF